MLLDSYLRLLTHANYFAIFSDIFIFGLSIMYLSMYLSTIQVGISVACQYPMGTPQRMAHRGGGTNVEWLATSPTGQNCSALCLFRMQPEYFECSSPCSYGCHPHYLKCYEAISPKPLNTLRLAFPSQIATSDMDASVPQITPYTNITACLRKFD